jgi:peptide/nickel transport system permease protein
MMLHGARTSLYIAFMTVLLSVGIGTVLGLITGYYRGWIDVVVMRVVDMVMSVPGVLVALVLASLMGQDTGPNAIIFAIAATGWTSTTRVVRGQVLSLRERDYVIASKALGASSARLMFVHILPGALTPLIVHATFSLSGVILVEASLSFLGLGSQSDAPTWGALLNQGRNVLEQAPFLSMIPGVAIMILVLSLNFLGDGLRDALDPRRVTR